MSCENCERIMDICRKSECIVCCYCKRILRPQEIPTKGHVRAVTVKAMNYYEKIARGLVDEVCENCGELYNLVSHSPKIQGQCDVCGGKLYQRRDDTHEAIGHRLVDYESQTQPILARLDADGKLLRVDASQSVKDIHRRLVGMIEDLGDQKNASAS